MHCYYAENIFIQDKLMDWMLLTLCRCTHLCDVLVKGHLKCLLLLLLLLFLLLLLCVLLYN